MKNLLKLEGTYLSFLFCIYFPYILTCYIFLQWNNLTKYTSTNFTTDIRANGSIHVRIHFSTTRGKIRNNRSLLDRFSIADEGKANGGKSLSLSLDRSTSNYPRVSSFSSFAARPRWRAGIHCEKKVKKVGWNSPCKSRFPSRSYGAQHFTGLSSTEII